MTLEQIFNELEEARKSAAIDPLLGHPQSKSGREMLKRQGEAGVERLTALYRKSVMETATYVVPLKQTEDYAEIAKAEAGAVVVDVDCLYAELADSFMESMAGRNTLASLQEQLFARAADKAIGELGFDYVPFMPFQTGLSLQTRKDVIEYVKNLVVKHLGHTPAARAIEAKAADAILLSRYAGTSALVILTGCDKEGALVLEKEFGRPIYLTRPTDDVTTESVVRSLTVIAKKVKSTN